MAKNTSTQLREFVKNALKSYYDNFLVKLSDIAKKDDVNPAIKLNNDGSVYIYGLGNYEGSSIQNASSLLEIIIELGESHGDTIINAGNNIQVDTVNTTNTISALGYTYNLEKHSFAIGDPTSTLAASATGLYSFAEGTNTNAFGGASHAEGSSTTASGAVSHAEGNVTIAFGDGAHAEGYNTLANGHCSHAEGYVSDAVGIASHAEGQGTQTTNMAEHAEGMYNQSHTGKTIHSIGIGTDEHRKNALEVINDGSIFITGLVTTNSYDGTSISNVSTLQEVINEKLDKSAAAAGLKYEVVQQLPANPSTGTIYLVPSTTTASENIYDEKMYINNTWETIGTTQTDLSNYYTKTECNNSFSSVGHEHGNISNNGIITVTAQNITSSHSIVVTNAEGGVFKTNVTFNNNGQQTQFLNIRGNWAVPTDTKNTVGATTTTSQQLYIVGVPNSASSTQSYINTNVYLQNDNIIATAFYQSSDERLKNIKSELSVDDCYKLINDCSTIIYSLKDDDKDQNQIGMIAQQVKEIMPEVVQESNGYYSINYSRLSVVALNLIKNLSERIIELEKDHNKLEDLIKRVEKLEK